MAKRENIYQRKDGRFEARYIKGRDENGKLRYGFCYGRTYEEAREKAFMAIEKITRETGVVNSRAHSFSEYCNKWLVVNTTRLRVSSCAKYKSLIEKHILPYFGNMLPYEITSEKMDDFTRILIHEKRLSAKTVRDILALHHSIFIYIKKRTGLRLQDLEIIYPKKQKQETRVLNEREEEILILFLAREMDLCKFGVYLALRTGLRIGEVCGLRWGDISMNTSTITICHSVQRVQNFDNDFHTKTRVVFGPPKSDSSYRTIPLMPDIAALCKRFRSKNPENFVLTGTSQCMEPRKLQRCLKTYTDECCIEEVHFHTLRHTFATRCIEVGFDMKTLSELLGHSNISITMDQYVHPNLDRKREDMNRLKVRIRL